MQKRNILAVAALLIGLLAAAPAFAAEVIQGKCLEMNDGKTLTIEEYDINFTDGFKFGHPTGINTTVDISKAKIGIEPAPGDIVRIAYEMTSNAKVALKVMNITKQNLMQK